MADIGTKISELEAATALDGTELLVAVQGGQTKKSTAAAVETLVKTGLTASDVGLGNVANERQYSANYPPPTPTPVEIGAVPTSRTVNGKALSADITLDSEDVGAIPTAEKGAAGGVAELDENGRIPTAQLPSYVDDVQEYASTSAFPATGESGKIYVALDTNLTYRWSGTAYVEISPSLALGETSSTAYRGDRGKAAYDFSQTPYTSDPAMNGTASPGSASSWARGDHVHPTDTSRQAVLTWDDAPTVGSTNPVKSGGIYDAILKLYPTDTASGPIASFPDGADDVPVVDLKAEIRPVQDLHGYDHPWIGGGGTNLLPISDLPNKTYYDITWTNNHDGSWTANGTASGGNSYLGGNVAAYNLGVLDAVPYTATVFGDDGNILTGLNVRIGQGDSSVYFASGSGSITFTPSGTDTYTQSAAVPNGTTVSNLKVWVQLEKGSVATHYSPYANVCPISGWTGLTLNHSGADTTDPETLSVSWQTEAGTVYGGTLDVTTGVLTVTHGQIASYAGETLPGDWISDRDVYAEGTSPSTGAQVVYELAEPITYQLTPTQVRTLLGDNNLWADTGDVTAEYRADLEKYIEKKIGEVQALILDNI